MRPLPLKHTICKITNGLCEMTFFACQKTKETCFIISTAHPNNGTSFKRLRKVGKKQMKNKEKERRLQKSLLKDFRRMRKEQESMTQMLDHKFHAFYFFQFLVPKPVQSYQGNCGINLKASDNEDYLAVKSHSSTTITVNGEENTRSGP